MRYSEKVAEKFKYEIECPKCGTPFIPSKDERGKRKFCKTCQPILSDETLCSSAGLSETKQKGKRKFKERNCEECTTVFTPEAPNQKFCKKCQDKKDKGK